MKKLAEALPTVVGQFVTMVTSYDWIYIYLLVAKSRHKI